jgi:hypothetical protein
MRKFSLGAFSTPWDFVKPCVAKILDKLSDFSRHFYRFNVWRKLFDAERRPSAARKQRREATLLHGPRHAIVGRLRNGTHGVAG